ncbi:MAG TPA: bifunctional riboflavin kinase/FAD synthetase [Nocardioidaceae bacterium]|nr:bifunctional riboflavin kinase/FAD synthetase [Nocardioidaceae bacterium]
MRIWRSLADVPADLGPTVVTIGNFDGVHRGHQHVVAEARTAAGGQPVVAVTFDPHPVAVLRPEHAPTALTTLDQRAELLAEAGVTDLLVMPFDRDLASWSPRRFVEEIVVDALHASAVAVGANFRFGAKAAGDVDTLVELGREHGFGVVSVDVDQGPQVWSSTYVRNCLAAGDVEGAAVALGRPFAVRGVVVEGDRRGRELGYPTANVPAHGLLAAPVDGVYAGWLRRLDQSTADRMPAAVSVGTNPTFDGQHRRVEAHVLDRDDLDLYGIEVEVSFVAHLRGMEKFDSIDDLLVRMADDVVRTRRLLLPA